MTAVRPPLQLLLDLPMPGRGEAPRREGREAETAMAKPAPESPAWSDGLMEAICAADNLEAAVKSVRRNKGAAGVDGITVEALPAQLAARWPQIEAELIGGRYLPGPVLRVKIPKPDGGMRNLGVPSVIDRVIQQAVLQRLQPLWDPTFSEASHGFRPGRSAHQAVRKAQGFVIAGYRWVVDIDLEKFFDRVNHDRLMAKVSERLADRRVVRLIRDFLTAGVLEGGVVSESREGAPQGGPLSPLLSNLVLDELDKELERRGHRFVRYADDCNIYVRTKKAGVRVMASLTRFIERRLKLAINTQKSAVDRPWRRSFLGFTVRNLPGYPLAVADPALIRFKHRVRELTGRHRGIALGRMIGELAPYLRGWAGYFALSQSRQLDSLDSWVRRRLRCVAWVQWKTIRRRWWELARLKVPKATITQVVFSQKGPWRLSLTTAMHRAFTKARFRNLGLPTMTAIAHA